MFALPIPLFFAGLFAIGGGQPVEMLADLGGFAGLMGAAWLLAEGQRAEAAYDARAVAKPPAWSGEVASRVRLAAKPACVPVSSSLKSLVRLELVALSKVVA